MPQSSAEIVMPRPSALQALKGTVVLALPVAALLLILMRGSPTPVLAGGVATLTFLVLGLVHQVGLVRCVSHKQVSPIYLMALLIIWINDRNPQDEFQKAAMFALVGMPLFLFVCQEFLWPDVSGQKRARAIIRRLSTRTDWPNDLLACKTLPEVRALREALHDDAEPVLVLLMHPRPQVRIAALAALEFRPTWKKGEPAAVLQAAKFTTEWQVRAAALLALANSDDPQVASCIAAYLRDVTPDVRRTAAEALLWNAGRRWGLVRQEIRKALSDVRCLQDGPLPLSAALPKQAIDDLTVWSGETGPIAGRSMITLLTHYRRELQQDPDTVVEELVAQITNPQVVTALRVEYARLLSEQDYVEGRFWQRLVQPDQPTYLRLLGAKALLRQGANDAALTALKEVARVPNREMAMEVAAIVQRYLRIDMGLPLGEELPEPQGKLAAEVSRRVLDWAMGVYIPPTGESRPRRTRLSNIARQITRNPFDDRRG